MILINYEQKGMGTTGIYSPSLSNDQSEIRTISFPRKSYERYIAPPNTRYVCRRYILATLRNEFDISSIKRLDTVTVPI